MGYQLQDRLEISIFINDKEYPLTAINLLQSLHITTTLRGSLPLLSMVINDVQRVFDSIGLQDGVPIRVVIKANNGKTKTYSFRKFNHRREPNGSAFTWSIFGYWDAPMFWNATTAGGVQGTSNNVLQTLAQRCGLKYDGTSTNDSQLWMPRNKYYRTWAKDIADHGYVDDTSCMVIGVDLDGTLLYKNVNNLPKPEKKVVAYQLERGAITAVDVGVNANSGFNNTLTGYQNIRIAQSSVDDDYQTMFKNLLFKPDSRAPLYNVELKDKLGRGPVRFGPISLGNVHQHYERAAYQNLRYRNLFSLGLDLLIMDEADLKLCEQITLVMHKEDNGQDSVNSGVYTVSGHSIYIQGGTYAERIGVTRHGTNEQYMGG